MGDKSAIEWTGKTWNPWHGCIKVTPGCKFCYMYREKRKYGQEPTAVVRSKTRFYDPLKWNEPDRVFTCSWSDFFIEQADDWRPAAWEIIKRTGHLTYQILTKRSERVRDHLPADWGDGYANVQLGFSAESQTEFDRRWQEIKNVPAKVLFLSAEPLLGPVDISAAVASPVFCGANVNIGDETLRALKELTKAAAKKQGFRTLDWIIVGGESGDKDEEVRPMFPAWARSMRDQATASGVPFFFKQWGEWLPEDQAEAAGLTIKSRDTRPVEIGGGFTIYPMPHRYPVHGAAFLSERLVLVRVGKRAAGRLLDGREWSEFPS